MPQQFHVLQCYSCNVFQVDIVKKTPKWSCKMCGKKQSLKKVYSIGSAKECRLDVQQLNEKRIKMETELSEKMYELVPKNELHEQNISEFDRESSKWSEFMENCSQNSGRDEEIVNNQDNLEYCQQDMKIDTNEQLEYNNHYTSTMSDKLHRHKSSCNRQMSKSTKNSDNLRSNNTCVAFNSCNIIEKIKPISEICEKVVHESLADKVHKENLYEINKINSKWLQFVENSESEEENTPEYTNNQDFKINKLNLDQFIENDLNKENLEDKSPNQIIYMNRTAELQLHKDSSFSLKRAKSNASDDLKESIVNCKNFKLDYSQQITRNVIKSNAQFKNIINNSNSCNVDQETTKFRSETSEQVDHEPVPENKAHNHHSFNEESSKWYKFIDNSESDEENDLDSNGPLRSSAQRLLQGNYVNQTSTSTSLDTNIVTKDSVQYNNMFDSCNDCNIDHLLEI